MTKFFRKRFKVGNQKGFTLIELMIVVAIIGILAAIAVPLYANVQARARTAKAQQDMRSLASAVTLYSAHHNALPTTLDQLSQQLNNAAGQAGGPFMASNPTAPTGWTYTFTPNANGTFTITGSGDGTSYTTP